MGDSTENTNKIDSYGVWVKRGPDENAEESPQANLDDMKMPDLSENATTDNDDMFITPPPEPQAESSSSEATEIPSDITMPKIDGLDGFDGSDLSALDMSEDVAAPAPSIADIPDGEVSFDDLLGGDSSDGDISLDAFMSGDSDEISLDDFLDDLGGGSGQKEDDVPDDSPLDINVTFNEDPKNQVPTEDIPLEDNSEDEMEEEMTEPEEESIDNEEIDEVVEENELPKLTEPIQAAPVMETVDFGLEEVSLDDFNLDESDDATAAALGASINSAATAEDGLAMFGKPKVVDYDLAITEDDVTQAAPTVEETESPNGQEQNTNTTTVDNSLLEQIVSDLAGLKNEITSIKADLANLKEGKTAIPSVKSDDSGLDGSPEMEMQTSEVEPAIPEMPEVSEMDSAPDIPEMPETIAGEGEATSPFFDEAPTKEPVEPQEGFFSDNDDDEIIALSGNELDNIVNTSEITEEENADAETVKEDMPLKSEGLNEPETSSKIDDSAEMTEGVASENHGGFFSDDDDETIALSGNELDNIVNTFEITEETGSVSEEGDAPAEEQIESEPKQVEDAEEAPAVIEEENDFSTDFSEDSPFGDISDEDMSLESIDTPDSGLSMDIDNDALEEPNLDEIEQNFTEDISLPKPEEIPMADEDKIIPPDESAAIEEPPVEEATADETATDEATIDEPAIDETTMEEPSLEEATSDEPVAEETAFDEPFADEPVAEVAAIDEPTIDEPAIEAPAIEEATADETASDEAAIEEPAIDETTIEEPSLEEAPSSIDYEETNQIQEGYIADMMREDESVSETLTDESVNYLSEDKNVLASDIATVETPQTESPATDLPNNLKSEVKSVLLYMDQLLENLPEEKIVEFAKSEHFTTYKKLFNELGLA